MSAREAVSALSALFVGAGSAALLIAVVQYRHRPRRRTRIDAAGCPEILTTYERRP